MRQVQVFFSLLVAVLLREGGAGGASEHSAEAQLGVLLTATLCVPFLCSIALALHAAALVMDDSKRFQRCVLRAKECVRGTLLRLRYGPPWELNLSESHRSRVVPRWSDEDGADEATGGGPAPGGPSLGVSASTPAALCGGAPVQHRLSPRSPVVTPRSPAATKLQAHARRLLGTREATRLKEELAALRKRTAASKQTDAERASHAASTIQRAWLRRNEKKSGGARPPAASRLRSKSRSWSSLSQPVAPAMSNSTLALPPGIGRSPRQGQTPSASPRS